MIMKVSTKAKPNIAILNSVSSLSGFAAQELINEAKISPVETAHPAKGNKAIAMEIDFIDFKNIIFLKYNFLK